MMGSPRLFLVMIALAACAGGFMAGAALERRAADRDLVAAQAASARALDALQAERIAREGKTDREFYANGR
ncbi:MAG: hypothetical protein ACOY3N_23365 [Bradyrhizobium sp.]|uniref:hypothetical protein n=1 Tax=Bradyrhizobium sp. TaxID=376 RepID=UPI003BF3407E